MTTTTMTELPEIHSRHARWVAGAPDGVRADLTDADLRQADLPDATLRQFNLTDAVRRWTTLRQVDLTDVDLTDAVLRQLNLTNAVLRRATLRQVDLTDAVLRRADLRQADLRQAVLRRADLSDADLTDADLSAGDLTDANLSGMTISPETRFQGVLGIAGWAAQCVLLERIREIVMSNPSVLDMKAWHAYATTHCLAGWAETLTPDSAAASTALAGSALIPVAAPHFYAFDAVALDWLAARGWLEFADCFA